MLDVFKVADLLIAHAVKHYGQDVDLVGYYGSYAQGRASDRSDLDIFYVPADGRNPPVARAFLLEGRLFDFWPIPWETMEGFATGRLRGWFVAPAIVHHARVLHARGEEPVARLAALKQKVLDLQAPQARCRMVRRAMEAFPQVLAHLGNLRLAVAGGDPADTRHAGWKVILAAIECLALANQTFFDRGWQGIVEQVSRLRRRPADLEQLIATISTHEQAAQVACAAEKLALGTRAVLREFQESLPVERDAADGFAGAYPEIKDQVGKLISACGRRDPVTASAAAWAAQCEVSLMLASLRNEAGYCDFNLYSEYAHLYRQIGLPDLMRHPADDPSGLARQADLFDFRVRQWLCDQSVGLNSFDTLEEFERSLRV